MVTTLSYKAFKFLSCSYGFIIVCFDGTTQRVQAANVRLKEEKIRNGKQ